MAKPFVIGLAAFTLASAGHAQDSDVLQTDARDMLEQIEQTYAYPERIEEGWELRFQPLRGRISQIQTRSDLLDFAESTLHRLCDHHAITGPSSSDSAALVPSFADLWIEYVDGEFLVTQVRHGSPAAGADIRPGDRVLAVNSVEMADAVSQFWSGQAPEACEGYAARVVAAGPRNADRVLTIRRGTNQRDVPLNSLYDMAVERGNGAISVTRFDGEIYHLRFNDSLGNSDTIELVDTIMSGMPDGARFIIDLRDTASGGNTTVARAVLGYFTETVQPYQHHSLPVEQVRTGVHRSWIEEVAPRGDVRRDGVVLVGRWTGSMGEGMAVGFDALGVEVFGSPMAGLLGAIYDLDLHGVGWTYKLPVERLSHVDGTARERFSALELGEAGYSDPDSGDILLSRALAHVSEAR